jgi:hypothetical protein
MAQAGAGAEEGEEVKTRTNQRKEMTMKHTLTLLAALLLASFAALYLGRTLPRVSRFGKRRAGSFQALETPGAPTSNDWN